VRPFHTSRLVSSSTIRMRGPLRSTRFNIGSGRHRSTLKSLGSYQLHLGRMAAVTKEILASEVPSLFASCEPNKRQIRAVCRTTSYAAPRTRCGSVSICIGCRRLARWPTLFTSGNGHRETLLSDAKDSCAAALGSISADWGETNVKAATSPAEYPLWAGPPGRNFQTQIFSKQIQSEQHPASAHRPQGGVSL
jgi:hypothetical protein